MERLNVEMVATFGDYQRKVAELGIDSATYILGADLFVAGYSAAETPEIAQELSRLFDVDKDQVMRPLFRRLRKEYSRSTRFVR